LLVDGILVALAYFLSFWLRFSGEFSTGAQRYERLLWATIAGVVVVTLVCLGAFGQYQRLWRFIGRRDYEAVLKAVFVATVVGVGLIALLHPVVAASLRTVVHHHGQGATTYTAVPGPRTGVMPPVSVVMLFFLLSLLLLVGARFAVQLLGEGRIRSVTANKGGRDVLIVGGGEGGRLVVRELMRNPGLGLRPVGFLDDDPRLLGVKDEHGLKVLGTTSPADLGRVLDEVEPDEVVIAIPSAPGTLRARVVKASRDRGIPVRTMPTVFELLRDGSGQLRVTRQLREVRVEDMLGRDRPGCKKYFTRGPYPPPIAAEMKIVPGTPVCAVVRFAISTTSSCASSSANRVSAGICIVSLPVMSCA
jgi:FlaA1/EpsC-like NDP-sugar epimerase